MSRDPLPPCPHQMRDGGLPPTHLSSSLDCALLGPRHWLTPPERAPDRNASPPTPLSETMRLLLEEVARTQQRIAALQKETATLQKETAEHQRQADVRWELSLAAHEKAVAAEANERRHRAKEAQRKVDAARATTVVAEAPERRHQAEGAFGEKRRHDAAYMESDADRQKTPQFLSVEASPSPRPTSYLSAVLSTPLRGSPAAQALPQATASPSRSPPPVDNDHTAVAWRARPRRRTGRRNRPRAPSPPDEGLPSLPIQQQGGPLTPTMTALARATLPCHSTVSSSTTHHLTTPPPPTLIPHNTDVDVGVYTLFSGGGGAHPFRECGPTPPHRKCTRRKRRPLRVCRRHGPCAPDHADSLLLGRRHRPRAPNQSTCTNGWA